MSVYSAIKDYCLSKISWEQASSTFKENLHDTELKDNDIRTYNYFFYYNFDKYLRARSSNLLFGDLWYDEAEKQNRNTMWCYEKNMQGPPFMEALIYDPHQKEIKFSLNSDLLMLYDKQRFVIAPRIEVWLDLHWLKDKSSDFSEGQHIMMGTWSDALKDYVLENEPYKTILRRRGLRNFHYEEIQIKDLVFENLEKRIMEMMQRIGTFREQMA